MNEDVQVTIKGLVKNVSNTSYVSKTNNKTYESVLIEFSNGLDFRNHSKSLYLKISKEYPVKVEIGKQFSITGTNFVARGVGEFAEFEIKPIQ